jgi:hypothetical protein
VVCWSPANGLQSAQSVACNSLELFFIYKVFKSKKYAANHETGLLCKNMTEELQLEDRSDRQI